MDYATFVARIEAVAEYTDFSTDPEFQIALAASIDDAEQRIYRELDFLDTVVSPTVPCTANSRTVSLSSLNPRPVVINTLNVITPAATTPANGTRVPLTRVSISWLDWVCPTEKGAGNVGVPSYWTMLDDVTIRLGLTPDAAYNLELTNTYRPQALSASNTTTYLSLYLPDLFFSAAMVFMSGYMKNFGAQADNPQMATSWEDHYQKEKSSAMVEEERKKFLGSEATPYPPALLVRPVMPGQPG